MNRSGYLAALLCLGCGFYYAQFFAWWVAAGLALLFTAIISGICLTGHRMYRADTDFPRKQAVGAVLGFSLLRWLLVFIVLQHHLPPETIFHYPGRVLWFIVPTTAALLLIAYGLALYRHHHRGSFTAPATRELVPHSVGTSAPPATTAVLTFRDGGSEVLLPLSELLHVQAKGEYLIYRCADRQYSRYQRLKEAAEELASAGFIRVHRSHLVAVSAIRKLSTGEVCLSDGSTVPVSRTYSKELAATI